MKLSRWERFQELCREHFLEVLLTTIVLGCCCLITALPTAKVAVLNLFFLPVVMAGFFLGRYRAGALALLSAITVGILVSGDYGGFAAGSPSIVSLTMTIWAAVLGLTAIIVGTLKDDLLEKAAEAREAQVGVIDILARYLQSVNPQLEHRAQRVARLCEEVAIRMHLEPREIDNIRVAAVLADMENVEITARIVKKAVGELKEMNIEQQRTVSGPELVRSLGEVLSGAFPLVAPSINPIESKDNAPFGSRVIQVVRAYCRLIDDTNDSPEYVMAELTTDVGATYHPAVLIALAEVVGVSPARVEGTRPALISSGR